MTDASFGGTAAASGFTTGFVYSPGIALPTGRAMANGSTACLIVALYGYVSGRSASRTVTMSLGGAAVAFTAGAAGSASATGWLATNLALVDGGTGSFRYDLSGSAYFARSSSSGPINTFDGGAGFTGTLGGAYRYVQAPTAPTVGAFTQDSLTSATLHWSTPSTDGEAPITGYRIRYGTSATLVGATSLDVGVSTSRALTGLTPGVQYYADVAAINSVTTAAGSTSVRSSIASVLLIAEVGDLDGWTAYGTLPAGLTPLVGDGLRRGSVYPLGASTTGLLREIQQSGSGSVTALTLGITRVFTGLTVGSTYRFNATGILLQSSVSADMYRLRAVGISSGPTVTLTTTPTAIPELEFVAVTESQTLRILVAENASWSTAGWFEAAAFYNITLTEIPDPSPYLECDTALEASLAQHFTVACDTVGAAWWVDRENVTRFRQAESQDAIVATFTDVRTDGYLEYIDIQESYDTKNTVNSLTVTNRGYDEMTGDADDVVYAVEDSDSVSDWGVRDGTLDITLYVDPIDSTVLEARLAEILAAHSTPEIVVAGIDWNAQELPALAASLDVQDRVRVIHEGRTQDSRVVGIKHTVTGTRWLIHLDLVKS